MGWKLPAAALCSGLLYFFGTGFTPVPALTWLAPLPVLVPAPGVSARSATAAAFLAGVLGSANNWAHSLHSTDVPLPMALGISAGTAVTLTAAVLLFRALVLRGLPLLAAVAAPAVWTGALYLVALTNPTGVMGTPANSMGDLPVVLQIASVTGFWGVEFVLLLVPAGVAAVVSSTVSRWRTGAAVAVVVIGVLGFGIVRLAGETGPSQRVALIAPNQGHWAVEVGTAEGDRLIKAYTDRIAALPEGVRLVVLPEGEFGVDDASLPSLVAPFTTAARDRGADVVVGYVRRSGSARFNTALVIPANGGAPVAYVRGQTRELVYAAGAGVQICGEVNLARPSRDYAAAGARTLAIPAADEKVNGWQHARVASLRGVENGLGVAWSGRSGALMVSDGTGRIVAEAHTGGEGTFTTVVADLPAGPGATPYTRLGDWFAWLCLVISVAGVVVVVLFSRWEGVRNDSAGVE
jgi:apolipoprotein N-acyltransferase